jgi:TRAP-type C4-dicarboxylate transport system permease small subunit
MAAREATKMILQSMIALASAALGLVAALAWNDAIKETIKLLMSDDESLSSKYIYAILATGIAVVVVLVLAKLAAKVGGEAAIAREAEG